jgi:tetratricopeptide (TPR) repeat protein
MSNLAARLAVVGLLALAMAAGGALGADDRPAPEPAPLSERIAAFVEQLGHENFAVRQRAQEQLRQLGFDAFDALSAAENHPDAEIALRARYLVRQIRVNFGQESDPEEIRELLKDYVGKRVEERLLVVDDLARMPLEIGYGPLCRVARYEASHSVAKHAALAIVESRKPDGPRWLKLVETINAAIGPSDRVAVQWIRAAVLYQNNPAAGLAAWRKLAAEEMASLDGAAAAEPDRRIALRMLQRQYVWVCEQDTRDEAPELLRRMVRLQPADPAELRRFMGWAQSEKAWHAIDELAQVHKDLFDRDPLLLYALAEARLAQDNPAAAEELAARALAVNPDDLRSHFAIAVALGDMGLEQWAERELRYLVATGKWKNWEVTYAAMRLAFMMHDRQRDREAAEALEQLLEAAADPDIAKALGELLARMSSSRGIASLRAQRHFYRACAHRAAGERDDEAAHLQQAIELDPHDAEVLIALHRLPNQDDERRAKTQQLIRSAAAEFERQINAAMDQPQRANAYNQYAWLVSNTEGDLDKALRYSHLSLEIVPNAAGYMDTLARCYFAKGDLDSALKHQTRAHELEPKTGAIARQLEEFRRAAEQRGEDEENTKPENRSDGAATNG